MASHHSVQACTNVGAVTIAPSGRTGFTLMEVLVALLIGGTIISVGRTLFDSTVDAQRRLQSRVAVTAAYRAGTYEIQRAVRSGRASDSIPFAGTASEVSFAGWCQDAYGGMTRCAVRISTEPFLSITERLLTGGKHEWVADSVGGRLDFVVDAASSEPTVSTWESASATPSAIRWISRRPRVGAADTLLFEMLRSAP